MGVLSKSFFWGVNEDRRWERARSQKWMRRVTAIHEARYDVDLELEASELRQHLSQFVAGEVQFLVQGVLVVTDYGIDGDHDHPRPALMPLCLMTFCLPH